MVNAGGCGRGSFEASLTLSFALLVIVFRCAVRRQDYLRSPARSRPGPADTIHSLSPATLVASHYAQKTDGSFRGTGWTPPSVSPCSLSCCAALLQVMRDGRLDSMRTRCWTLQDEPARLWAEWAVRRGLLRVRG